MLTLGLIPFAIYFFQGFSIIACVANLIVVPWFCFLVLPFCLFGVIFLPLSTVLSHYCFVIADINFNGIWHCLTLLANLHGTMWHVVITTNIMLLFLVLAMIIILLPIGMPGRWLSVIWFLPILYYPREIIPNASTKIDILDVGQGLAIVVQTAHHTLLYDAGPKLSATSDKGESVVVPYLRINHIQQLDKLIVSHGDNDHVGGVNAVMQSFPVNEINASSDRGLNGNSFNQCQAGLSWQWDKVRFDFIYPNKSATENINNRSCVLKISMGSKSILLPGDIEQQAEKKLLLLPTERLAASIIIAPHHGSKTSANIDFIHAVAPSIVVYATGYLNRYHFPSKRSIFYYDALAAKSYNTAYDGTISITMDENHIAVSAFRELNKHYWDKI